MTTPPPRPERQSRVRAGLGGEVPIAPLSPSAPLPQIGPDRAIDLDRLRAGVASAISAETSNASAPSPVAAVSPGRRTGGGSANRISGGRPGWVKIAVPIGVVAALATVGVVASSGGATKESATEAPTTTAIESTTAAPTTSPPTTAVPAVAMPTTAPPTTAPPTTAAAPPAPDPSAPPPHKATYRGGKLYLDGRITSDAEAQKYVAKAAAVLGADNVVNNYVIDPSVPLSTDGTVYVDEPFLFETGSSSLNPTYTGVLGLGVAALKLSPAARMVVTGYTDSTGRPEKNQELSVARANAVVDYMVVTGGIDRTRFDAIGAGDQNPVGDNNTEEGRKLNRRIDVKLVDLLG